MNLTRETLYKILLIILCGAVLGVVFPQVLVGLLAGLGVMWYYLKYYVQAQVNEAFGTGTYTKRLLNSYRVSRALKTRITHLEMELEELKSEVSKGKLGKVQG